MRVTNGMMTSQMLYNLNNNLRRMNDYNTQLATGKQIQNASDDPILASKILKHKSNLTELDQYTRNTEDALSWIEVTEAAVQDMGDVMQRIRELMVQASNGSNSNDDMSKIADELEQLKKQIVLDGNTTFAGRYVFSSFDTDIELLNDDGTYNIDVTDYKLNNKPVSEYQISIGEEMNVSTNGIDIFGFISTDYLINNRVPLGTDEGIAATKSVLKGSFDLTDDYTADNLDITLGGNTYSVNVAGLDGTSETIDKEVLVERLKTATFGAQELSDVADVFFDASNNLVIKARATGATGISTASGIFAPTLTAGTALTEATLTGANNLTDAEILADPDEFMRPFYVTVNGIKQKVQIDTTATLTSVGDYITELNSALNLAFGAGKVVATGSDGNPLTITTNGTLSDGRVPSLEIEGIKGNQSQLIVDIENIIENMRLGDNNYITQELDTIDDHLNNLLTIRSDIGARVNRLDLVLNRNEENKITYTKLLSAAEDANMAEAIMEMQLAENVYRAALSSGSKVIQPTLVDFIQ